MKNNLFDNQLKEKLHDYQSSVPNGLWEKIAEKNDRKKVIPFWRNSTFGIIIIVILMGVVSTVYSPAEKQSSVLNNKKENTVEKDSIALVKLNSIQINKIDKIVDIPTKNTAIINKENNDLSSKIIFAEDLSSNEQNKKNIIILPKKKQNEITTILSKSPVENFKHLEVVENTENNSIAQKAENINTESSAFNNDESANNFVFTKAEIISTPLKISATKNLQNVKLKSSKNVKVCLACPGDKFNNWHVSAIGSVDVTSKIVTANGVNAAFLRGKDTTETMNGGFTLGVRVSRNFGEHFYLKSGVQFTQVNEKLNRTVESERRITTVINIRTVVRAPGDTLFVRDTSSVTQISYINKVSSNIYKSIEIPLLTTFETGNDSWKFGVTGGVVTNLTSWYKGETFDSTNQLIPLGRNKGPNGFYKSNVNLSVYGSVSILKRLDENFEAFIEPYAKYSLSSNNTSTIGYNKRFNVVGLFFGLRYKVPSRHKKL